MRTGENLNSAIVPGFNQSSPQVRFKSEAPSYKLGIARTKPVPEDSQKLAINEEKESEDIVSEPD